jgi:hypothetical protein
MIRVDTIITYEIFSSANYIWNVAKFCELVNDRRECDGRVSNQLSLGVNYELYH